MLSEITSSANKRDHILFDLGIDPTTIIYPRQQFTKKDDYDYKNCEPKSVQSMYGENDLSRYIMFDGGYINWGYWENIDLNKTLTNYDRQQASKELYNVIFNKLSVNKNSNILEVGFGLGSGIKQLVDNFEVADVTGIDIVYEQINRAIKYNNLASKANISLLCDNIEDTSLPENYYTHIYICEAAQHFNNFEKVAKELRRISKPNSKIVIAAPFPATDKSIETLRCIIPYYEINMSTYSIKHINDIIKSNFSSFKITSLGKHIWKGLDYWLATNVDTQKQWSRVYYPAYLNNLIDYYLIEITS